MGRQSGTFYPVTHGVKHRRRRLREAMANMILDWRESCNKWVENMVEEKPGISTSVCNFYSAYIRDNPFSCVDKRQFAKVLYSKFPSKKRRQTERGGTIVYQGLDIKTSLRPSRCPTEDGPKILPDSPFSLLRHSKQRAAECSDDAKQEICIDVPSRTLRSKKVGTTLVSNLENVRVPVLNIEEPGTARPKFLRPKPKRRKLIDSIGLSDKEKDLLNTDSNGNSTLLVKDKREENEVIEESLLKLDYCTSRPLLPQLLELNENHSKSDVQPKQQSEISPTSSSSAKHQSEISPTSNSKAKEWINKKMVMAHQWVDKNLVHKKGVTTESSRIVRAYARDNPNDSLLPTSLFVVIRGKFPARRRRKKRAQHYEYYYQDVELVKRNDVNMTSPTFPKTSVTSGKSMTRTIDVENNKNNDKVLGKAEKINAAKMSVEEPQAHKVIIQEGKQVTVNDKVGQLPVVVFSPPTESVIDNHDVPYIEIRESDISSHDGARFLSSKSNIAMFPSTIVEGNIAKVSQSVFKKSENLKRLAPTLPAQNLASAAQTTCMSSDLKKSTVVKESTFPQALQSKQKIIVKTVSSINETVLSSIAKPVSLKYLENPNNPKLLKSHLISQDTDSTIDFKEKENLGEANCIDKNVPIKKELKENENLLTSNDKANTPLAERQLPDMDVLDYFRNEMVENNEKMFVNPKVNFEPSFLSERCGNSGDEIQIIQNEEPLRHTQIHVLRNVKSNNTIIEKEMTSCEVEIVKEINTEGIVDTAKAGNQGSSKSGPVPASIVIKVNTEITQGKACSSDKSEHKLSNATLNINSVSTGKETMVAKESNVMPWKNTQVEDGVQFDEPSQKISKIGSITKAHIKSSRRWDEDLRSFAVCNNTDSISKSEVKKRSKSYKEKCSQRKSASEESSLSENNTTKTCVKDSTCLRVDNKQRAIKIKKAVLSTAFDLLETGGSLTDFERTQKLEAAMFEDNPAVHYMSGNTIIGTKANLEELSCIPSVALRYFTIDSFEHITFLLEHHQMCPGLWCQICHIIRAAYVHVTLFNHRCPVWYSFIRLVSWHSRMCKKVSCSVIFCNFVKHELYMSQSELILSNHNLNEHKILETEFSNCVSLGPHSAELHCNHHQVTELPISSTKIKSFHQDNVEARALRLMSDVLLPNKPEAKQIVTPIIWTFKFVASNCNHSAKPMS